MFAVWSGRPAANLGGTADIVQYAIAVGRPLVVFNPTDRTAIASGRGSGG